MKLLRTGILLAFGLGLQACASVETASRNAPLGLSESVAPIAAAPAALVAVTDYDIRVSRSLTVSEANSYFPNGDIVWRGDGPGDRHHQIARIFQDSIVKVQSQNPEGAMPVTLEVELVKFHALTEKTRYSIGGVHNIVFNMTVTNAETGEVVLPTREVYANLRGYGGAKAIAADQSGMTQRVRITQHLTNVVEAELAAPGTNTRTIVDLVDGLEINVAPTTADGYVQL